MSIKLYETFLRRAMICCLKEYPVSARGAAAVTVVTRPVLSDKIQDQTPRIFKKLWNIKV
jgi:hypothetical protein